ncbi:MAG: CpaF family protein [bacterium]|nr:CpaF family protein [bacterium]
MTDRSDDTAAESAAAEPGVGRAPAGVDRSLFRGSRAAEMIQRIRQLPAESDSERRQTQNPTEPARRSMTDYAAVKGDLQSRLLEQLSDGDLLGASEERIGAFVSEFADDVLANEDLPLNATEREQLGRDLLQETLGLGPLAPLVLDPAVTDVLVNGPNDVFVERFGRLERSVVKFRDGEHLLRVIERIAARVGRRIDQSAPMADFRLPDGSRVNATIPPVSIDYPTLSIRRFGTRRLRGADLLRYGSLSEPMLDFLHVAVRHRTNLVISGGTGAGKSTLLGAIAEAIGSDERIVTIEDTAELLLDQPHVVRMEGRPPNTEGAGEITIRQLVINSLRMRPDRILVGEVRSSEALDMLQAMNTGHDGSLTTVHANSPRDALSRLETMVLMAGTELPSRAIREQITSAVQLLVHVTRSEDGVRRIASISEITGLEGDTPLLQELFRWQRTGRSERRIEGRYVATGITPRLVERLRDRGAEVPQQWFRPDDGRSTGFRDVEPPRTGGDE